MKKGSPVQRVLAQLASNTRLFVPSGRHIHVQRVRAVGPRSTRMQLVRDLNPARDVLREHRRRQSVKRVVRLMQHVLLVFELDNHSNWPEDILLDNPHVRSRVREYRWLDPIAFRSVSLASKVHLCALFFARFDVIHNALHFMISE